jgi:hypothetical protein
MASTPPEDLVVAARQLDPNYHAEVSAKWTDPDIDAISLGPRPRWRLMVPPILRHLWGRLDYETRLAVFVVAASEPEIDWPDPNDVKR